MMTSIIVRYRPNQKKKSICSPCSDLPDAYHRCSPPQRSEQKKPSLPVFLNLAVWIDLLSLSPLLQNGLTSLVTGCVERLLSGCPLSAGSLVLTYINKFCNSLEFHNMSPMSKGAFYGRTGVCQPGPSRVKIQD